MHALNGKIQEDNYPIAYILIWQTAKFSYYYWWQLIVLNCMSLLLSMLHFKSYYTTLAINFDFEFNND